MMINAASLLRDNLEHTKTLGGNQEIDLAISFLKNAPLSRAQLFQDLMVLFETKTLMGGYFVEFGACDGKHFSNTHLLEKNYCWNGIVAEPSPIWHDRLFNERSCFISTKCVYNKTGESVVFNETPDPALSTVDLYSNTDQHAESRVHGRRFEVQTITLQDLLAEAKAPNHINYLSIDTEGSEFDILSSFNFEEYRIDIITVEHNFRSDRSDIYNLLSAKGYRRKYERFSMFDDWYVRLDI